MRFVLLLTATLQCCGLLTAASVPTGSPRRDLYPSHRKQLIDVKVRMPLVFEPNVGQAAGEVQWVSRTPDGTMLLTAGGATLVVRGSEHVNRRVTMRVVGARPTKAEPVEPLSSFSNYFIGSDPSQWHTRVPHYGKIRYRNVYPGIDLLYYGADRRLEYDFILSPGAKHGIIELAFDGADRLEIDRDGDLIINVAGVSIRQFKPKVFQWINGKQQHVAGGYRLSPGGRVQFALGRYDRSRALVIDPVLQYSTYIGGSGHERGVDIATDRTGATYVAGFTNSGDLRSAFRDQQQFAGKTDGMVAKLSAFGDSLEWISYYGGKENDVPTGIVIDTAGNAVISGWTESADLPTRNPISATYGGAMDAFVAKFNASGTDLIYATYLGGSGPDFGSDIAIDATGNAYISGWTWSPNFPVLNSFQSGPAGGGGDVFVTKLPPSGTPMIYSTYVGGNGDEIGTGIAVDARGAAYVTGGTTSTIFPNVQAIQAQNRGQRDAFLFKLVPSGNSLEYSTLFGGSLDELGNRVAVDGGGNAYVSGYTQSIDFPVRSGFQSAYGGGLTDVFIFKVNAAGSAVEYASYLGGSDEDSGLGELAVDTAGTAYLTGFTASPNFPTRNPVQQRFGGGKYDAFVTRIAPAGNSLLYSSFLGGSGNDNGYGIVVDSQGVVTVSGWTASADLPSSRGTYNSGGISPADVFVARISADTSASLIGATPGTLTFAGRTGQDPAAQTIAIASTGTVLTFSAGSSIPWLRVTADRTTTPAILTVSVVSAGLAAGAQTGEILINAPGALNSPLRIPVIFNVTAVPVITSVLPSPLPRGQDANITITGTGFVSTSEVFADTSRLQKTFLNATTLQAVIPAVLLSGAGPIQLSVRNPDAASVVFPLQVGTAPPSFAATGILNAATLLPGSISAGQLIAVNGRDFGPDRPMVAVADATGLLGTLFAETRLLFDGVAAPIISVSANQVNAVVPSSVANKTSVQVELEYRGQRSAPVTAGVGPSAPGLFTANSTGTGQAAALNENFSPNSAANPVLRGSHLILYATGFGLTTPPLDDGRIPTSAHTPVLPINVQIGGLPAEVVFAGSAPGLISGVLQINVRVAENVTPGDAVPVVLSVGGASSRTSVTIAVR